MSGRAFILSVNTKTIGINILSELIYCMQIEPRQNASSIIFTQPYSIFKFEKKKKNYRIYVDVFLWLCSFSLLFQLEGSFSKFKL